MKREEMEWYTLLPDFGRYAAFNGHDDITDFEGDTKFYKKSEVDAVMDSMESRIKELEAAEYKWFELVRDFVSVLGNDPYRVYAAIRSRLRIMYDNDEIERFNKVNQSILDRIKVLEPHEWNRTCRNKEESK